MKSQLYIPDKIKVGYQERKDTYTKRLAYVIYYKGKTLMKEKSWTGWIDKGCDGSEILVDEKGQYIPNKDENGNWLSPYYKQWINPEKVRDPFPTHDFENVPTEGFVFNKGVGGQRTYSWYEFGRIPKIRVYDPRDFEFEITIENMLFILAHNAVFPGKGIEGQFVYAWDGPDLILLPIGCKEYQDAKGFTDLQSEKVPTKELVPGRTYQNKSQENLIYLGRFNFYYMEAEIKLKAKDRYNYRNKTPNNILKNRKQHVFADAKTGALSFPSGLGRLANCVSTDIVSNYAELLDSFNALLCASFPVSLEETPITIEDKERQKYGYSINIVSGYKKNNDGSYTHYSVTKVWDDKSEYDYKTHKSTIKRTVISYQFHKTVTKLLDNNMIISKPLNKLENQQYYGERYNQHEYFTGKTLEDVNALNLVSVDVVLENGNKFNLDRY